MPRFVNRKRGYIVNDWLNVDYIMRVPHHYASDQKDPEVILANGDKINISRQAYEDLMAYIRENDIHKKEEKENKVEYGEL